MRLFLCGGGSGEKTIEANKIFSSIIDHSKPLLYIPLAMNSDKYPSCLEWITEEMKDIDLVGIDMVTSSNDLVEKDFNNYCGIFIGGGNTFKLLSELKESGAFDKIKNFIDNDGVVFGGSAGAIIFGKDLESCVLDDSNDVGLTDIEGFNAINDISLLCHYTNRSSEKDMESMKYLLELSKKKKVIALPEEDTMYINGEDMTVIGTRPYYVFENGLITGFDPMNKEKQYKI